MKKTGPYYSAGSLMKGGIFALFLFVGGLVMQPVMSFSQDVVAPSAQGESSVVAQVETAPVAEEGTPFDVAAGEINPNDIPSLVFTYWEHTALVDAKKSRGAVRPPTAAELRASLPEDGNKPKPPPEERELQLGGIVYVASKDWTIWLNGKRITPTAVPREVLDLNVYEDFIEIKWHDDYTNQIFPIRLRPHQRFNLDTRIFLPG